MEFHRYIVVFAFKVLECEFMYFEIAPAESCLLEVVSTIVRSQVFKINLF